ncbi:DNA-3-methyladenine glycosylase [Cohnella sp. REN36]|uniref:DNA-3-methyladenine glycosylase family protein n=1 Tax=Cohnella sp. REN36 TaxID=2887347 RepID=UPI001D144549|nr:DNA-3-methyladenine glycosylase 2 [Cohnella sp. REN36]MCC3371604.1 DNA-3-methyladenine glycosylase [Cohnella sp. REN36]
MKVGSEAAAARPNEEVADLSIPVPEPFSFRENCRYLAGATQECLYAIREDGIYKAIPIGEEAPVVRIRESADGRALEVRFLDRSPPSESAMIGVDRYIRDWFDLDRDLSPFYRLAERDELLGRAVSAFPGLRNMGIPDLFEALAWGIIGQQINLSFAYTLKRRLVERFGRSVTCGEMTYWTFPTANTVAELTPEDLAPLRMTARKVEYLIGVARLLSEGRLSRESLLALGDLKQAEKALVGIRGIGPWTAHYVLMRCLRMPAAFPVDDVGLQLAIQHLTGMARKPTPAEIRQLAAGWQGWESYATFYLWRFLY